MSAYGQMNNPFSPEPAGESHVAAPAAAPSPLARVLLAVKQGNILLVALVLAGLAGVYLLSLKGGPAAASAQQVQDEMKVDAALTNFKHSPTGSLSSQKSRTIVDMFYHEMRQKQVSASELNGNPFVFKIPGPSAEAPLGEQPDRAARVDPDLGGPAALAAVKGFKLQSVLMGANPSDNLAMVSNNLLAVGQEIAGWTVRKIEPQRVTLSWRDQEHVLEMPH